MAKNDDKKPHDIGPIDAILSKTKEYLHEPDKFNETIIKLLKELKVYHFYAKAAVHQKFIDSKGTERIYGMAKIPASDVSRGFITLGKRYCWFAIELPLDKQER